MSLNSRLRTFKKSLNGREVALLWLKTSQGQGGFLEYWKSAEFHPWVSQSEEAGLLYHLVFHVNGAVLMAAQRWRELASCSSLLCISLIAGLINLEAVEGIATDFVKLLRQKLCKLHREVLALERAIDIVSLGYFDGHDVLFADVQGELDAAGDNAKLLVRGFNLFAADNGRAPIDTDAIEPTENVKQLLNEWVMLSRSHALAAGGKIFEARDEVWRFLKMTNTSPSSETPKREECEN